MNNNHEELRKELQTLSPFLEVMKTEKEGFKVPDNYFSSLADDVLWKIRTEPQALEAKEPFRKSWFEKLDSLIRTVLPPRYALALASIVLLLVAGIFFTRPAFFPKDEIASLSKEEIHQYLINHAHELDPETLVDITEQQKGTNQEIDPLLLPSEEVELYLNDLSNGVDPETLDEIF